MVGGAAAPPPDLGVAGGGVWRRPAQGRRAADVVPADAHRIQEPRGAHGLLLQGRAPATHLGGAGGGVILVLMMYRHGVLPVLVGMMPIAVPSIPDDRPTE